MVRKVGYLPQRTQAGIDAPVTDRELAVEVRRMGAMDVVAAACDNVNAGRA